MTDSFRGRHGVLANRTRVSGQIHYDVVVYEDAGAVFSELGRRMGF